ncbi:MAG TPA: methyltransferase [Flavobacteriales bacterium]|nr:methyltransferase [Flavobacteriales bacterium]
MAKTEFRFKQFVVQQDQCAMKVSTDGVLFGSWVNYAGAERILDIGTGTGVLALIAAQRNSTADIEAVELDLDSAKQASENFVASSWGGRLHAVHADVRQWTSDRPYDLIICNPPYYDRYLPSPDPRVELAKHNKGLLFSELLAAVERLIAPEGRLAVIIPSVRETEFLQLAKQSGLLPSRRCMVAYVPNKQPKRVLLELGRSGTNVKESNLTVQATGPFDYSPEYRAMVSDILPGS